MFEVKKREGLKVKIYDEEFTLKRPTVSMISAYSSDIETVSVAEKFQRAKTLLCDMGLRADVVDEMELDHLQDLIEFLTSSMTKAAKKN